MLTVIGTVILLWPTVLHTRVDDAVDATARRSLWLCVGGLALIGAASLLDLRLVFVAGIVVYLLGLALVVIAGVRQARHAGQWGFASWSIAAAIGWFVFGVIAFGICVAVAPSWQEVAGGLGWLVGPLAVGFAAQILIGAMSWGLENLALDQKKLDALGFAGVMRPLSTSCADHMGSTAARIETWDGKKWEISSDYIEADEQILKPMIKAGAEKYLADKKMTRRDVKDCQS